MDPKGSAAMESRRHINSEPFLTMEPLGLTHHAQQQWLTMADILQCL